MTTSLLLLPIVFLFLTLSVGDGDSSGNGGALLALPVTVPAFPLAQELNDSSASPPCRLDLSDELFGGVHAACSSPPLDRDRCCPVLAAWLYAAHARTALSLLNSSGSVDGAADDSDAPMVPYDNQRCVDALGAALERRGVVLPRPNATCDAVLCFCGIRLHQIGSLRCPAAFNSSSAAGGATAAPTAAVKELERSCRNASYAGCSRCVQSLQKLKGNTSDPGDAGSLVGGDRERRILSRDCQLMGLTWLLAKNTSAYIPTVSAVLRAMLYSAHPADASSSNATSPPPKCSSDKENMPLAVDSLEFQHAGNSTASSAGAGARPPAALAHAVRLTIHLLRHAQLLLYKA